MVTIMFTTHIQSYSDMGKVCTYWSANILTNITLNYLHKGNVQLF